MSAKCFCQNEPSLWLWKDSRIFLCSCIVDNRKCSVESICMIWRIHKDCTVFCIQSFINHLKSQICLPLCCKAADHSPALWIQPHVCLRVSSLSDNLSPLRKPTDKTIFIPTEFLDQFSKLLLFFFQVFYIFFIFFVFCKLFQDSHCIIEL